MVILTFGLTCATSYFSLRCIERPRIGYSQEDLAAARLGANPEYVSAAGSTSTQYRQDTVSLGTQSSYKVTANSLGHPACETGTDNVNFDLLGIVSAR
jgi:hypothetical protein